MEIILKYFPHLTIQQKDQIEQLRSVYEEWNQKINVISRKDIDKIYERHVLHSMALATFLRFRSGSQILDVGTGGGFPGIPLAILFPDVQFTLLDAIGKKIKVVTEVSNAIGLQNVTPIHENVKNFQPKFDFVVSRAVTDLSSFLNLVSKNIGRKSNHAVPNGIIYLKGGDLNEELKPFGQRVEILELSKYFDEEFFETKKVVYLPVN